MLTPDEQKRLQAYRDEVASKKDRAELQHFDELKKRADEEAARRVVFVIFCIFTFPLGILLWMAVRWRNEEKRKHEQVIRERRQAAGLQKPSPWTPKN